MTLRPSLPNASLAQDAGLAKDDRGVMLISGIFFSFVWIGLVWFILGVGTAINYHENLQNAADASAFAGAVYDARGMNLLAMINVIMGVVLAVLIIAHIIQIIIFIPLSIDCLSCIPDMFCGYGWESCPGDCSTMSDVNDGVKDVDTIVHDILKVAHLVEVGIAVGWPWVAAGKSTTLVPATKLVPLTTSFSYSQVPSGGDISAATGGVLNLTSPGDKNPARYGLPVQSDTYVDLCKVAFLDMTSLGGLIPGNIPGAIAGVLNGAGNWFCDAGGDSHTPTTVIEVASDFLLPCALYGFGSPVPALPGDMKDVGASNHSQSPMKLIKTKMGTDYFGVWSTAIGAYDEGRTPNRVQIAAVEAKKGNTVVAPLPSDVDMGVTRSEFYYDPRGNGPGSPTDTVSMETTITTSDTVPIHNCMWNMRWRARLRRYHVFPGPGGAGLSLEAALNNIGGGIAGAALGTLLGGGDVVGLEPASTKVDSEHNEPAKDIYH